jgi:hypothetical protein
VTTVMLLGQAVTAAERQATRATAATAQPD